MKLEVNELCADYEGKPILDRINFQVAQGQFVSLLGPSGCGKSTLLNLLSGLLKPKSGSVFVDGQQVKGLSDHFAYMPQDDLLFPWKTVLDNVCLYAKIHGGLEQAKKNALDNFPAFGLEGYQNAYPDQLSGGMRQRAAFLRTALCSADILLLDEPFGALDVISRGDMQDWLLSIMRRGLKRTALLVTHDVDEAIYLADRILVLGGMPTRIVNDIDVSHPDKSREWLYDQTQLRTRILNQIKGGA